MTKMSKKEGKSVFAKFFKHEHEAELYAKELGERVLLIKVQNAEVSGFLVIPAKELNVKDL